MSPSNGHLQERVVPFTSGDGFECNLINVRGASTPEKGPVMIAHGAGVRANIFRAPVEKTIVQHLVENGYDVWLENWRASIDLPKNPWTLDKAAAYDHPQAVRTIVKETGWDEIKAIVHCQGSTSFVMSAVAGLVPEVKTIISNAVSLHPVVPRKSFFAAKMWVDLGVKNMTYINPQWGLESPDEFVPKLITAFVRLTHHECHNMVCKMASFTYGTGKPTLWLHENISEATHEWIKQEFANVPLVFFQQMKRCLEAGHLVPVDDIKSLPRDLVARPPETDARFCLIGGEENVCFLPESQVRTYEYLNNFRKDYHSLHVLPNYSHLDVFFGEKAVHDVYPLILEELDKPN